MKAPIYPARFALKLLSASLLLALAGGAQAQEASAAPAAATPAAAARPNPADPKPFKDVIKDAKEIKGFFTLHQKDEKVWLEIRPEQLDQPFFFSVNIPHSIGERRLYGGQMGMSHMVVFKKVGNQIQLLAKNTDFTAQPGTPQAQAVSQAFSDSLLASAPVVSAAHPDSKAILVDASALLFSDIVGYSTALEYAYRMPFALDGRNSSFQRVRADENLTGLHVNAHFAVPRISAPPLVPPPPPVRMPSPPTTTPDPRSMFIGFYYSFAPLPKQVMSARVADDRVGHFVTTQYDYTDDKRAKPAHHMVNRWRLEKKDPTAALSEPVQPIVYWLDKNIPEKYRKSATEGVLEWNLAFEKIGFKNALVVKQQTDKDEFDTMDARHASIRWFVGADVGFAIGPSQVDPRSGEILDADIGMSDVFTRGARRFINEDTGMTPGAAHTHGHQPASLLGAHAGRLHGAHCNYAHEAGQELGFALGLLEARGDIDPDSPEAEALAQAYMKDVIMHEVGHTLGLRHNFRSSTIYSLQQLADPQFTKKHGVSGSVMDYNPFNIAPKGEKQGEYVMSTLGPYDYWAIEYAYKPIPAAQESAELTRIALRSTEPLLAYGTDEDAHVGTSDPDVNLFDLGSDSLSYFKRRLTNTRELWDRLQTKQLKTGESYESLRRSFEYGLNQFARAVPSALKHVGGVTFLRDHAGTGRATFTPIAANRQREALNLVTNSLFKPESFKISPELVSRLGADHFQFMRGDVSIGNRVLAVQTQALDQLMGDAVAHRLLDSQEKVADPKQVLSLAQLHDALHTAIWAELKGGKDISGMRRNLQREHVKRLANSLVRPSPTAPADARSLQRQTAIALQREIAAAVNMGSKETRAHLAECLATLNEALKASLTRAAV